MHKSAAVFILYPGTGYWPLSEAAIPFDFQAGSFESSATLACLVARIRMAYEFDLQEIEGPIEEADGSKVVEFILGFDADSDTIVVMSVMMVPTDRTDTLELCFGIRTKTPEQNYGGIVSLGEISPPDYSREGSQKYIPTEYKLEVLSRIAEAVSRLAAHAMPNYITMETFYADLPLKALEKYDVIGGKIIACGYTIEDQFRDPPNHGIDYWLFKKRG
jgi:hypothetical protein